MPDNFAVKLTFFLCAAAFSLLHIIFCIVFLAVRPYKEKKRDIVLRSVTIFTVISSALLLIVVVLTNFSESGFHLTTNGAIMVGSRQLFALPFIAPFLKVIVDPLAVGVLTGCFIAAIICAFLHVKRAINKKKLLRRALVPVSGREADEQIDIDFKDDNSTDDFVDNLRDDNIDKHIEFLITKAKDGLPQRSSALFEELVKIVDGLPEEDKKEEDKKEDSKKEDSKKEDIQAPLYKEPLAANEIAEKDEEQEPHHDRKDESDAEKDEEQEPHHGWEDENEAAEEDAEEQEPYPGWEDESDTSETDGEEADVHQDENIEQEIGDEPSFINDDVKETKNTEKQTDQVESQAVADTQSQAQNTAEKPASANGEFPKLKVRTIIMPRYFENRVQDVVVEPMETRQTKKSEPVEIVHEEIKPKKGKAKGKNKTEVTTSEEKEMPPIREAEKASELYTKRYIILNRQNAANAFSDYLEQKKKGKEDIDNVNTIILK